MNHTYRVIWNAHTATWQAVSETATGKTKSGRSEKSSQLSKKAHGLKQLAAVAGLVGGLASGLMGTAIAAPTGGVVASGTASIGTSGSTTTINQGSSKAIINWNDFSIGSTETVNFVQPDANAIALNRVVTATPSSILGNLNANGQVFIVNPNGITFGSTAQVNVGGLVASTLDISDSNFNNGTYRFANSGNNASISNAGNITVANTGTAALIAPSIQQAGTIVNNDGSILLTAASDVTLSLTNRVLNSQTINAGHNTATINNSAGSIQADGGKIALTAQGVNSSSSASISSAGSIRAQTLAGNDRGAIDLLSDMVSGAVNLTGTLDASAPSNGFGGIIRTHGATVVVADSAAVTTRKVSQTALPGTSSYWQIRTHNITVGAGGTISGSKLSSSLNDGSVTLTSVGTGTNQGYIHINDAVSSNSNVIFSMAAINDINVNNNVGLTANLGRLVLNYGTGHDYNLNNNSKITLSGAGATLQLNGTNYTVINSLGVAGDTSTTTLQGMKNNLTGNYALGSDINADATSTWNGGKGFDPIGNYGYYLTIYEDSSAPGGYGFTQGTTINPFSGQFHGLGHTVDNLYINRPDVIPTEIPAALPATFNFNSVGLFGATSNLVRNIEVANALITGSDNVGALVGVQTQGGIRNSVSSGFLNGSQSIGGLVGLQRAGIISNSSSSVTASGASSIGGLVGISGTDTGGVSASIVDSYTTGSVFGNLNLGGLVGESYGAIQNSYSSVSFSFANDFNASSVGGLVGKLQNGTVSTSYATGNLQGQLLGVAGGLIGYMAGSSIVNQSFSTGNVNGTGIIGGLVASMNGSSIIQNSYATGNIVGTDRVGGLVGDTLSNAYIKNSYATGNVTGNDRVGGLIGYSVLKVENSNASGAVTGVTNVGGLIGYSYSQMDYYGQVFGEISNSHATGAVIGEYNVGGLIGYGHSANIRNSYALGEVAGNTGVGGLAGTLNTGYYLYESGIFNSYSRGGVSGLTDAGGLVGKNYGEDITNSYWDTTTSGQSTSAGGTGKTTAELKQIATFSGWDIADVSNTTSNSVWVINEDNATPWLR